MAARMHDDGLVRLTMRVPVDLTLDDLTWVLVGTTIPTGTATSGRELRAAIVAQLAAHGQAAVTQGRTRRREMPAPDRDARFAWARRRTLLAFCRDFTPATTNTPQGDAR